MGNIRGREGGSQRFSQEGWLVTLAGLIIARSEVEVNGKVWGFISLVRGQRPEARGQMSRFPFPGEWRLWFLG